MQCFDLATSTLNSEKIDFTKIPHFSNLDWAWGLTLDSVFAENQLTKICSSGLWVYTGRPGLADFLETLIQHVIENLALIYQLKIQN